MIGLDVARQCAEDFEASHKVQILEPEEARKYLSILEASLSLIPGVPGVVNSIKSLAGDRMRNVSLTIPTPGPTLILLSEYAVSQGDIYLSTLAHELVHKVQIKVNGALQAGIDYVDPDWRSLREAEAGGVGLWIRYVVTNVLPAPTEAGVTSSDLYHLDEDHKKFGRVIVNSALSTSMTGAIPPHSIAIEMLAWLRKHAPDVIKVPSYLNPS